MHSIIGGTLPPTMRNTNGLPGTLVSNVSSTFKSRCLPVTTKRPMQTFFKPRRVHPRRPSRAGRKGATKVFTPGLTTDCPFVSEDASRMKTICASSACGNLMLVT